MQRDLLTLCLMPLLVSQTEWHQIVERLVHDKR